MYNIFRPHRCSITTWLLLCGLLAVAAFIIFYRLGTPALDNWDEAWYAEMTKQMLRSHEFVLLSWNQSYLYDKPPMYMWFAAGFSYMLGLTELAIRLPSAIAGLLIIGLVTWHCYRQYGLAAATTAFASLAFNGVFIWRTRSGNIDTFVTLFIVLVYLLMTGKSRWRLPALGLLFAAIYLTKAALVFFPLSIFVFYEVVFQRQHWRKNWRSYLLCLSLFVGLSGLWLWLGYLKAGRDFSDYYLFHSDQNVAHLTLKDFNLHYIAHVFYALRRFYFALFIVGLLVLLSNLRKGAHIALLLFACSLVGVLSFTLRNDNWHLVPAMPFWSIIIGMAVGRGLQRVHYNVLITILIVSLNILLSYRAFVSTIRPLMHTYAAYAQRESALYLKKVVGKSEPVARIDHLYPTTVFYADRKVYAAPREASGTWWVFMDRPTLISQLHAQKIRWVSGKGGDMVTFAQEAGFANPHIIRINADESVWKIDPD